MATDLAALRQDYLREGLNRKDLRADPMDQFRLWLDDAIRVELPEPNAMVLATVDASGCPSQRTVLLKALDHRGLVFFTNYESRKSKEIGANPRVSLHFLWVPLERQVAIVGRAERISMGESLRYFASRPRGSQLGAWVSQQSAVITSRKLLELKLEELKRKFADGEIPLPSFWGGYRVVPETVEFWKGRTNRLHDRFCYQRGPDGAWGVERLAP